MRSRPYLSPFLPMIGRLPLPFGHDGNAENRTPPRQITRDIDFIKELGVYESNRKSTITSYRKLYPPFSLPSGHLLAGDQRQRPERLSSPSAGGGCGADLCHGARPVRAKRPLPRFSSLGPTEEGADRAPSACRPGRGSSDEEHALPAGAPLRGGHRRPVGPGSAAALWRRSSPPTEPSPR